MSDSPSWSLLRRLFDEALEQPAERRREWLEREAPDPTLRSRLDALLTAHEAGGDPEPEPPGLPLLTSPPGAGEWVGPYRLLEIVGEGGFGVVFLAEQEQPLQRRVALKLLRVGAASTQVLNRFEAERQALALMDHPNIASVYDAGATADGQPYFVMEYVDGRPLTDYADDRGLSVEERLTLFLQLCDAVQHAHQKGVIHRDLKPSNVLVTESDGRAQVKVIDFGVAKALGPRLSTETVHTQIGMLIGTPEYMSPEQAESSGVSVDTRSDVYSLGVLLYELLVGARPFDRSDLPDDSVTAMLRAVRETPAPRLGARLATLGERAPNVAAARRSDVSSLARRLRGDLEWIALRALEKEPARRYASVDALAEDVRAALNGDAVTAHPPSVAYQVHRFVRRHRLGVAFAGTVFTLLVAFGVSMSVLYGRQQVERMKAERMNSFLQTMLAGANPLRSGGGDVSVRDLLDAAAHDLDELHDEPEVEAAAAQTMAYSYESLFELESADSLARRAIRAYESAQGPLGPGTLEAKGRLASIFRSRGMPDSALALQEDVVAGLSRRRDASPRAVSHATAELGRTYQELGRYEDAARQEEEAIRVLDGASLQNLPTYGSNWSYLGRTYQALGRIEDAEHAYRRALEANRANRGEESAYVAADLSNLASALRAQRKFDEAEPLFASAAELNEKLLGPDHPGVASIYNSWGLLRKQREDYAGAESLYVKALDIRRRAYGEAGHPEIATSLNNLGVLCRVRGRLPDAERYYREALDMNLRMLGEEHPNVAMSLNNLAVVLTEEGRPREAEECARRALGLRSALLGPLHPDTVKSMRTLADAVAKPNDADSLRQEADRREAERAAKSAP